MDATKEEYALRLIPDFDVFNIAERTLFKERSFAASLDFNKDYLYDNVYHDEFNHFFYINVIFDKKIPEGRNGTITLPWNRMALRSTKRLKIADFQTRWSFSFIELTNPSESNSDYFYYLVLDDIDYAERKQSDTQINLAFTPGNGDYEVTEIVGVIV